ncbi:hypothetical protein C2S52_021678 [Perilla frutescens var. hirtella]|nr:hypothetical protein C2S52_021678 [Perilla frutescens var. hirtella]KAH6807894.1 hypothetical protein C2S51_029002 [Perilla frutescens var. frutescens]
MERRGQDRDIGYNPPESPVKLPLAPIVSTPPDRRGILSTRRGSSIFSPTQTLDHHRHHLNPPPPPPPHVLKDPSPDPDPSTPNSRTTPASQAPPPQLQVPPPPEASTNSTTPSVRYRECLKNHAASMGGHVVDGCGEFMPNGEEGTVEALRCAACDCHRNFHRKEVDGEAQPSTFYQINPNSGSRTPLVNSQTPPLAPSHQHRHHPFSHSQGFAAAAPAMVSFGGNSGGGGGGDESSSEDLNMFQSNAGGHAVMQASSRKRFRTKFSQEQKDRMQELAEKLGWRIQKQDEEQVQQLCNETGVKRQVFKVWMHNNKQAMKKRQL